MECKCDMRTKLVGDGCEVCNPALALSHAKETIADQAARIAEMEKRIAHFEAGEYICHRCGIRQDPPKGEPAF